MFINVKRHENGIEISYTLKDESSSPFPKITSHDIFLTYDEISKLELYTYSMKAGNQHPGSWSWHWFEDILLNESGGIRLSCSVSETSDDFLIEECNIYAFKGEHCVEGEGESPGGRNRIWNLTKDE